jgi:hypothetical protein
VLLPQISRREPALLGWAKWPACGQEPIFTRAVLGRLYPQFSDAHSHLTLEMVAERIQLVQLESSWVGNQERGGCHFCYAEPPPKDPTEPTRQIHLTCLTGKFHEQRSIAIAIRREWR